MSSRIINDDITSSICVVCLDGRETSFQSSRLNNFVEVSEKRASQRQQNETALVVNIRAIRPCIILLARRLKFVM